MADNLICERGVDKNRLAEVLRKEFKNPAGSFKIEHRFLTIGTTATGEALFLKRVMLDISSVLEKQFQAISAPYINQTQG
jgi:hypothetical protein